MKIRITQPGFEGLTGWVGVTEFIEGVSKHDVPESEIDMLAGVFRVENAETAEPAGIAERLAAAARVQTFAEVAPELPRGMTDEEKAAESVPVVEAPRPTSLTEDELGQIADKGGIKALRDIAGPLGVKGRAIPELITEILAAQRKRAPAGEA